jgi:alpha-N-arabinofuranosidase
MYGAAVGNAKDAADLVEYLNSPNDGSNPNDGTDWAAVRAANGHPEPYNIKYFEIGNEMFLKPQRYWLDGASDKSYQYNYVFGGTVAFTRQPVVDSNNYNESAGISPGTPNLVKYAQFPPVNQGTDEVFVGEAKWIRVNDLSKSGKENVYAIDYETGKISFGDGTHGNIPEKSQKIGISYATTHDGFNQYYEAMKAVDPAIQIYSCVENSEFFNLMGDKYPYDGVVYHSYITLPNVTAKNIKTPDKSVMDEVHDQVMYMPDDKKKLADKLLKEMRSKVGSSRADKVNIIITEYGILNKGEVQMSQYRQTLDVALYTAKMLMNWIDLGVPLANKQTLLGGGGASIGDGPDFLIKPVTLMFKMFTRMFGDSRISSFIANNPVIKADNNKSTGQLQITASKDNNGNVYLIAVNASRTDNVATAIDLAGSDKYKNATVWTLNGESYLTYNTASQPDNVTIKEDSLPYKPGSFRYTFPAHSLTAIKLVKAAN